MVACAAAGLVLRLLVARDTRDLGIGGRAQFVFLNNILCIDREGVTATRRQLRKRLQQELFTPPHSKTGSDTHDVFHLLVNV
jgi:hypothetical protein